MSFRSTESSARGLRWIRLVQSGRLVYVTVFLPLLTFLPALVAFTWLASSTIPVSAPEHALRLQYAISAPARDAKRHRKQQANSGSDSPASSAPGDGPSNPDLLNDYLRGVMGMVNRAKRYPRREKSEQIEGEVLLRIKLNRSGNLTGLQILKPSPYDGFNRAALDAVRRAGPFPTMPHGVNREQVQLRLRLRFVLQ